MVAFTGPNSTTSAPSAAMKRPSEVPPPVLGCGSIPRRSRTAAESAASSFPGGV
jgi:hypothetical protein